MIDKRKKRKPGRSRILSTCESCAELTARGKYIDIVRTNKVLGETNDYTSQEV